MLIAAIATALLAPKHSQRESRPFVDPLFSDDMVLQRDMADPIWGWTTPGAHVSVSINGTLSTAVADANGKWMTRLPKFSAGGAYTLMVDGTTVETFENVTFGDVWICSGQSNMEFGVGNLAHPAEEIADGNYPNIRLYRVPKLIAANPVDVAYSNWEPCTPANLMSDGDWNGFSAVGYFFGKQLFHDLNVPIGLIHTSWGGTIAEAWASAPSLQKYEPEFDAQIQAVQEAGASTSTLAERLAAWYAKNDAGTAASPAWSNPSVSDADWATMKVPGLFQKAGLPEFVNHASVVWLRREFELPTGADFKNSTIHFVADDNDATWVNGVEVGATDGPQVRRAYVVPDGVLHSGTNTIVVRVTDTGEPGGIYDAGSGTFLEIPNRPQLDLSGDWKLKLGAKITGRNPLPGSLSDNPNQATVLYNGMISPLGDFGIKGAIWYQGESNVGRAKQYRTLLPAMIRSWRDQFHQGNFEFLIVQLAGFMHPPKEPGEDGWADLREAQMIASRTSPNAGIATAIDIGNENDIHPKNKEEVGRRLALVAEAKSYGKHIEYAGPTYRGFKIEGHSIRVSLDHASGLKTSDGQAPKGFSIEGSDRRWHWADAKIDGDAVVVSSDSVPNPIAVGYAWATFLDLNLQNKAGLPAFPFRSDRP